MSCETVLTPTQRKVFDIVKEAGSIPATTAAYRAGCLSAVVMRMVRSGYLVVVARGRDGYLRHWPQRNCNRAPIVAIANKQSSNGV